LILINLLIRTSNYFLSYLIAEELTMTYLDPVDTQTMKKLGINVAVLIGVALLLIVVAGTLV